MPKPGTEDVIVPAGTLVDEKWVELNVSMK